MVSFMLTAWQRVTAAVSPCVTEEEEEAVRWSSAQMARLSLLLVTHSST